MKTLKDILIVLLLSIIVALVWVHELDLIDLKHRAFMAEGGLMSLAGGLFSIDDRVATLQGGLPQINGGLDLHYFRAASAQIYVREEHHQGPITHFRRTQGTGVFVSDNILLTAKHVVEDRAGLSDVKVLTDAGSFAVQEILEDSDDDLAIIIITDRTGPHLESGPPPSLGDEIICIGSPLSGPSQLIVSWGRVSSEKWRNSFIYDGFVAPGCSGGPIIVDGRVVGIVEARLVNPFRLSLGFGTPISRLDPSLMARIR